MVIPPQGFRHAALLLLTSRARAISMDASGESATAALVRLARDLVALADDMHAKPEFAEWLLAEYTRILDQLPHAFDRTEVLASSRAILAATASRTSRIDARDLFLVYAPEDRLPVAAPLAIELTKRQVSVAFAEYEVTSSDELNAAAQHGLEHHRGGAILWTDTFSRLRLVLSQPEGDRLRVVRQFDTMAAAALLTRWAYDLRGRAVAK